MYTRVLLIVLFAFATTNAIEYHYQYPFSVEYTLTTNESMLLMVDNVPVDTNVNYDFKIVVQSDSPWCISGNLFGEECYDDGYEYTYSNEKFEMSDNDSMIALDIIENDISYLVWIEWSIEPHFDASKTIDDWNLALYILIVASNIIMNILVILRIVCIYCYVGKIKPSREEIEKVNNKIGMMVNNKIINIISFIAGNSVFVISVVLLCNKIF